MFGLGTAALVLPLRHPVVLAKEIASLHMLSGGRFRFGIAVGWDPAEFESVQVPMRERGRRTDEALDLIMRLLTEENVTFEGAYWRVEDLTIYPRVADPPVVVGRRRHAHPRSPHTGQSRISPKASSTGFCAPMDGWPARREAIPRTSATIGTRSGHICWTTTATRPRSPLALPSSSTWSMAPIHRPLLR